MYYKLFNEIIANKVNTRQLAKRISYEEYKNYMGWLNNKREELTQKLQKLDKNTAYYEPHLERMFGKQWELIKRLKLVEMCGHAYNRPDVPMYCVRCEI
jgi:hypothetical protein